MWTMPVPSSSDTSFHSMTRCVMPCATGSSSNGPRYVSPTSALPGTSSTTSNPGFSADLAAPFEPYSTSSMPSFVCFTLRYVSSGCTAAATLPGSVHGVVVHTSSDSPGLSSSGNFTYTLACVTSWYPSVTISCSDSPVAQRGHHGMT